LFCVILYWDLQRELREKATLFFVVLRSTKEKVNRAYERQNASREEQETATKKKRYKGVMSRCRKSFADNRNSYSIVMCRWELDAEKTHNKQRRAGRKLKEVL
jgi:hypothetical protein